VVITLLIMTFFSPCVNAVLVMFKERGLRAGLVIIGFVTPYALVMAAFLHWVCRMLGVSFS
jgi:ferrous iron transport protein B